MDKLQGLIYRLITFAHLPQTVSFSGRVNVQHRGHLLNVAGRTRIPKLDSQPGRDRSTTASGGRRLCRNLPGIDMESEYSHSGDNVPKEPSSVTETSETINSVFKKCSSEKQDI
jgi:hypothetical protein